MDVVFLVKNIKTNILQTKDNNIHKKRSTRPKVIKNHMFSRDKINDRKSRDLYISLSIYECLDRQTDEQSNL